MGSTWKKTSAFLDKSLIIDNNVSDIVTASYILLKNHLADIWLHFACFRVISYRNRMCCAWLCLLLWQSQAKKSGLPVLGLWANMIGGDVEGGVEGSRVGALSSQQTPVWHRWSGRKRVLTPEPWVMTNSGSGAEVCVETIVSGTRMSHSAMQ